MPELVGDGWTVGAIACSPSQIDSSAQFSDRSHAQVAADTAVLPDALAGVSLRKKAETEVTTSSSIFKSASV